MIPVAVPIAIACNNQDEYIDEIKDELKKGSFDDLVNMMSEYEIPIGILSSIIKLSEYSIYFIIDDSGSMSTPTDLFKNGKRMTRFEEVHETLNILLKILSNVNVEIHISFLNNKNKLFLEKGFLINDALEKLSKIYTKPDGRTPIYNALSNIFKSNYTDQKAIYLFTDGEPSDSSPEDVYSLIKNRKNPNKNPLTLISCTDDEDAIQWMKDIDEDAMFVAEVDDYESEKKEVKNKQGPMFPYSKGIWLMCILVGAICPDDLDSLDESKPLTKFILEHLLGRNISDKCYHDYFYSGISRNNYDYNKFLTMKKVEDMKKVEEIKKFEEIKKVENKDMKKEIKKIDNKNKKTCSIM